jgi:hypothetical protein
MAVLPDPLAADAVVMIDSDTRTLAVRPAQGRGYPGFLWRQALQQLRAAELSGRWDALSTVPGLDSRRNQVSRGAPAGDGS